VLKCLSVITIVIAPAKTGNDNKSKKEVINKAQRNKGILNQVIAEFLIFTIVTI
jgi:hypothetical protein